MFLLFVLPYLQYPVLQFLRDVLSPYVKYVYLTGLHTDTQNLSFHYTAAARQFRQPNRVFEQLADRLEACRCAVEDNALRRDVRLPTFTT